MNKQTAVQRTGIEQIQEEAAAPEITLEKKPDVKGADQLQAELGEMADSFDMTGFKCASEKCGLVHNHDSTKHRASDSSDMGDEEAASRDFNPNCHCGLNEAARRGDSWAPSPSEANRMAPIPDGTARAMDSMF